jgi:hypothetical protein
MDAHYRSFEKQVLPELVKNKIAGARNEEYGERNSLEFKDRDSD